jgi:hypothetical protein
LRRSNAVLATLGWLAGLLAAEPILAAPITFEAVPAGAPAELLPIGDQYLASDSVSFALEGGGPAFPVLAQYGAPAHGFVGPPLGTMPDTLAAGQPALGSFFLTDDGSIHSVPRPLRITFAVPMASVGGWLLDLDRTTVTSYESFELDIFDGAGALLDSLKLDAGMPGTGDGRATPWRFDRATAEIGSVRVRYVGTVNPAIGWGLDDFFTSTVPIPEPRTLLLLVAGLAVLGARRHGR